MAGKKKKKPMTKFPRRMQKKLLVMFGVVSFMLIFLIGRLMYIEHTLSLIHISEPTRPY